MLKIIAAASRKPGMTHEEYSKYLREIHGALVLERPLSLLRYVQNHVDDGAYGELGGPGFAGSSRDSVVELYFRDMASMQQTLADPYTRDVIARDGSNFSDMTSTVHLLTTERVMRDPLGLAECAKLMLFIKAREPLPSERERTRFWESIDCTLAKTPDFATSLGGHSRSTPLLPGNAAPPEQRSNDHFGTARNLIYDAVESFWLPRSLALGPFRSYLKSLNNAGVVDTAHSFFVRVSETTILDRESRP